MRLHRLDWLTPLLIIAIALLFIFLTQPAISAIRIASKAFATSAVILLAAALGIGALSRAWPAARPWVAHRKAWGVTGFAFGLFHAALAFSDPLVFDAALALTRPNVQLGLAALIVFSLLVLTSTAWAQQRLGRHWKSVQRLGYVGLALVGADLLVLGNGTFIRTPVGIGLEALVLGVLALAAKEAMGEKAQLADGKTKTRK